MAVAITTTHLTDGSSGANVTSVATASISPKSNRYWTLFVRSRNDSGAVNTPTVTGCGLTWTMQQSNFANASMNGCWLFRGMGSPSSGTLTIDYAGQTQSVISWTVDEWANVARTGTNGSDGIVQSVNPASGASNSFAMTLAALGNSKNVAIGFLDQYNQITTLTLGSGFTALKNNGFDGNDSWIAEYKLNTVTVDASSSGSQAWMGIGAELKFHDNTLGGAFLFNLI